MNNLVVICFQLCIFTVAKTLRHHVKAAYRKL